MKKNLCGLLVAGLTFFLGISTIYFFAWDKIESSNPFGPTHSSEKNSPFSVLAGTSVRIKPYDATFEIPGSWLTPTPFPTPAKNLYLNYQELNELYWNDRSDAREARVINSVLSFENCAAHIGDRDWGNDFWNDLQARVYFVDLTPEEIAARVEKQGCEEAAKAFEGATAISDNHGNWEGRTLDIWDAPSWSDFYYSKNLNFYYRSFGKKSVVFVFLHAESFDQEITLILDSFKWSDGG